MLQDFKNIFSFGLMGVTLLILSPGVQAKNDTRTREYGKLTRCHQEVCITKYSRSWDTMDASRPNCPVKWERHLAGSNPRLRLCYDHNPPKRENTAYKYAVSVSKNLQAEGCNINDLFRHRTINGNQATLLEGYCPSENRHLIAAVFRTKTRGIVLRGTTSPSKWEKYRPQIMQMLYSTRIEN